MIDECEEFVMIGEKIKETESKIKECYKGGIIQHALLSDLFKWLDMNGGCVFLNRKTKQLKTQRNVIENYITKYGIKFQVISSYKDNPLQCINLKVKLL